MQAAHDSTNSTTLTGYFWLDVFILVVICLLLALLLAELIFRFKHKRDN
jgi:hypothetical protein